MAVVFLAFTCESAGQESDCPVPADGTRQGAMLGQGQDQTAFPILYPCKLPNSQVLTAVDVVGDRGKQSVAISFDGPFAITVRQSQVAPARNPDPSGASHTTIRGLFQGIDADLIERYEGTGDITYNLFWAKDGMYYEVLMVGPPLQRKAILDLARSLTPLS